MPATAPRVMLLCDAGADPEPLRAAIESLGWRLELFHEVDDALAEPLDSWACCIVCDDPERTRLDGFLRPIGPPIVPIIGAVRQGDVARTVMGMQLGARSIVEIRPGERVPGVSSVLAVLDELVERNPALAKDPRDRFVRAPDSPLNGILDILGQLARAEAPILISGESGTGKDLLARTIHELSPRAHGPLVAINCGAIPPALLEAELFGAQRGAFTGAGADRAGCFEAADGGTIFLDEIGEMPPTLQVKLLRVLQDKQVTRLGSTTPTPLDFRVIAATNLDIEQAVARADFREDLFYRLSVLPVHMPALRERPQDIGLLADSFIARQAQESNGVVGMTREVRTLLKRYDWPGNVRELQNVIERACILKTSGFIEPEDLPSTILDAPPVPSIGLDVPSEGIDMTETLGRLESSLLERALHKAEGNKARAARLLGINRTTLVEKLKRRQITFDD